MVQNIGEYYYPKNTEQNNNTRNKISIFGPSTALGKLLYAVDHNMLSSKITARPELNNGYGAGKIKQELIMQGLKGIN